MRLTQGSGIDGRVRGACAARRVGNGSSALIGKSYDDAGVLRAAHAFERTLGTLTAPHHQKELTA